MNEKSNKIIAIYVRVSTNYQVDKDSLPFQKKEVTNYAKHILHVDPGTIEIFEDAGRSGKDTNRPAFERMMKKVRKGEVSHVLVYKLDRISRNLVDFSIMHDEFKKYDVTFISLNEQFDTSSALGEAVLKIILVFAELERKLTSERVKDVMINRAQEGLWNGAKAPYGWQWNKDKKLPEHHPEESKNVQLIYNLYEQTHSSCKVVDYLNDHNIRTKCDGEWTTKTVADLIRNPIHKGDYRYNYRESSYGKKKPDEEVVYLEGVFPEIIAPAQWDKCNKIMDSNTAMRFKKGWQPLKKNTHVFGNVLYCSSCGGRFQCDKDRPRNNGFCPSKYFCGNKRRKKSCSAPGISDVRLGPFIFNYISNMVRASAQRNKLTSADDLEKILLTGPAFSNVAGLDKSSLAETYAALRGSASGALYLPGKVKSKTASDTANLNDLQKECDKIVRALERLKKLYLFDDEGMDEKDYLTTKKDLEEKLIITNNKIAAIKEDSFQSADEMDFIKAASTFLITYKLQKEKVIDYSNFAAAMDAQALKDFINIIIEQIWIKDGKVDKICFKNGLVNSFLYHENIEK